MAAAAEAAGDSSMPVRGAEPCDRWNIDFAQLCEQKSCGLRCRRSRYREPRYARPLRVLGVHAALQGDRCHGQHFYGLLRPSSRVLHQGRRLTDFGFSGRPPLNHEALQAHNGLTALHWFRRVGQFPDGSPGRMKKMAIQVKEIYKSQ